MSLTLTLISAPRAQAMQEARLDTGELVIGRSPAADWQIDDPDMFVSRAHCTIRGGVDGYTVTDTSSSGLFVDDAHEPLGNGNSVRLRDGTRLRIGEYVVEASLQVARSPAASPERTAGAATSSPAHFGADDFFSMKTPEEPKAPRPSNLPNPFETQEAKPFDEARRASSARPDPIAFDDPFSLDPLPSKTPAAPSPQASPDPWAQAEQNSPSSGGWFDAPKPVQNQAPAPVPQPAPESFAPSQNSPSSSDWFEAPKPVQNPASATVSPPSPQGFAPQQNAPSFQAAPPPANPAPLPPAPSTDAMRDAFLRGLGVDASEFPTRDPLAEMERFGREYRVMMDGYMQLLRKRAEEKGNARVSQTVVGASGVNPLKFLPTVDDVLVTFLTERSSGFLTREPAIADAVRDLVQHHVRAWRGVQGALRQMIDRFDPALIEEELKASSAMETLMAGGRSAKAWELYRKRHREIATNAEQRFMGDLGTDFRNAYEGNDA